MKRNIMTGALLLIALSWTAAPIAAQTTPEKEYIEVQGRVEDEVAPDEIFIRFSLDEKELKRPIASVEKELLRDMAALGIDLQQDVEVESMTAALQKYWYKKDEITATKGYTVKINSVERMDRLFALLTKHNIANGKLEKTQLSKDNPIFDKLYERAAAKAKQNATAIARGLGQEIGKAIYAYASYSNYPRYAMAKSNEGILMSTMAADGATSDNTLDLSFRKIKVECSLQVRFLLK